MEKVRITVYISTRQQRQLELRATRERLPMAEIIRRALDTYLAWDDPMYTPLLLPQTRNGHSSPR